MGLKVCKQKFERSSFTFTNVIGYKPGLQPGSIVVGAHYDSRPYDGAAPGAEDNGSGAAGLLMMAYAFQTAKLKPEKSVYFVGFAGEEPGLLGSEEFAHGMLDDVESIPAECRPHDG